MGPIKQGRIEAIMLAHRPPTVVRIEPWRISASASTSSKCECLEMGLHSLLYVGSGASFMVAVKRWEEGSIIAAVAAPNVLVVIKHFLAHKIV